MENMDNQHHPQPESPKENHQAHNGNGHDKDNGHDKHAGHNPAMFQSKFWLSLILTLPVVFWSDT